ncbi:chromatin remodeling complex subunit [Coccidioides immitis RS]|uniref:Chromatin remodeling complex subunit n=1 Tax=Coccidioides immitis (strain RS) TaxID=246410 RepID=A0A0D8JWW0_COCIM|nr:chromatin remodeling complex subunit [Coccidioides immitis RS]KJF60763.1 chromatin remodeling complex subunit [Coccidioides immitis RS]
MPSFKDEHILIIAPGSQTTLAQLGLPDSFTPAKFRFPTRMFPAEKKGEWEPFKIRQKVITVKKTTPKDSATRNDAAAPTTGTSNAAEKSEDTEMKDAADGVQQPAKEQDTRPELVEVEEEQVVYEEDPTSDEGAVYPIRGGAVVDWTCFFALLTHIYNTLSPPFHTPIMLIAEPVWTLRDRETLTQFIFEKFKTPAFCLMDSAVAVCYAYGTPNATVVDIGHEKADVTAVTDFMASEYGRGIALAGCGGDAMTSRLFELLQSQGFTREMCEQLKRSNICEILPTGTPLPTSGQDREPAKAPPPSAPGKGPDIARNVGNGDADDDEGILDVAAIVSGNTSEYLAKREREKAEKAATRKGHGDSSATTKQVRLPNSKKEKATFQFQEYKPVESRDESGQKTKQFVLHKRDVEVGTERFLATTPSDTKASEHGSYSILDTLAAQIHHTIHSVSDTSKRSELWDSMIILGNGSKIRGFPQALVSTITQKYVLSPSGTIFTSEIPSALSTPLPTGGTNTPAHQPNPSPLLHPAAHGVNPLLVAATHANNPIAPNHLNPSMNNPSDPNASAHHRSTGHSQTPTSVKLLRPPEYFPEWKDQGSGGSSAASMAANNVPASGGAVTGVATSSNNVGMEEATFLGAQVAAKVIFVIDQGLTKGFLSRVEYNDAGPTAIHDYSV